MPIPQKSDTQKSFVSKMMRTRWNEGKHDQKQNAAIAYSVWRNRKKKKKSDVDVKRELLALNDIAASFEKEGNLISGKIITEAMKKISENLDEDVPRLPTKNRLDAELLREISEMEGISPDKIWSLEEYEKRMRQSQIDSEDEPYLPLTPRLPRRKPRFRLV